MIDTCASLDVKQLLAKTRQRATIEALQFGIYGTRQGFQLEISEGTEAGIVAPSKKVDEAKSLFEKSAELKQLKDNRIQSTLELVDRFPNSYKAWLNLAASYINAGEIQEARSAIEKALKLAPKVGSVNAMLGRILILEGKVDEAIEVYQGVLKQRPDVAARETIALLKLASGRTDEAIGELKEAIDEDRQKRPSLYYNLGLAYLVNRKGDKAISHFRKALQSDPTYYIAYSGIATAYAMLDNLKKAEMMFRIASKAEPTNPEMRLNLGQILMSQGKWDEAIAVLSRLSQDFPMHYLARETLGGAYIGARRYREAAIELHKIVDVIKSGVYQKDISDVLNSYGMALALSGEVEKGIESFRESIEVSKHQNIMALLNLVWMYLGTPKFRKAQPLLDELRDKLNDDNVVLDAYAYYCYLEQNYDKVVELTRQALRKNSKDYGAACLLSTVLVEVYDDYVSAEELLRPLGKERKVNSSILNNLAYALVWQDRFAEARSLLDRIPRAQEQINSRSIATRGFLHMKQGDILKGSQFYNEAARMAIGESERHLILQKKDLELGRHYLKAGQKERARKHLEKAVQADVLEPVFTKKSLELLSTCS